MPRPSTPPPARRSSKRPLLSACLIVKDEEAVIRRCLEALQPLVDEIVVHDTGSTDRTIEICESMGARVLRGSWRDDFSWARNVAIEAARGEWVIIADADEVLEPTNFKGLRRVLREGSLDGYRAQINNASDISGNISVSHSSVRIFRRRLFRYAGRIHEQVVSIAEHKVRVDTAEIVELTHWGYMPEVMAAKNKADRNIRLAEAANDEQGTEKSLLEAARAHTLGGNVEEALRYAEMIRDSADEEIRHNGLQVGVQMLIRKGDLDGADEWMQQLLEIGRPNALTQYLEGYLLTLQHRFEEAIEVFDRGHDAAASMAHGVTHASHASRSMKARCLAALGRVEEALQEYLEVAAEGPLDLWPDLLRALYERDEMHRAIPAFRERGATDQTGRRLRALLAMLTSCPIVVGDSFAEALYADDPGDKHALAFITLVSDKLGIERAITWSVRARQAGLAQSCPLIRQCGELGLPATQRVAAAAIALGTLQDTRAFAGLRQAARDLDDEEVLEALYTVGEVAPAALEELVMGVVTSQARALVMARALVSLQAVEQADAVLRHALETHTDTADTARLHQMLAELESAVGVA